MTRFELFFYLSFLYCLLEILLHDSIKENYLVNKSAKGKKNYLQGIEINLTLPV